MVRHTTCPSVTQLAASLLLAAILSGCASQQTFRVVDAKSGEPLGDVRVERLEDQGYRLTRMPFVVLNEFAPAEKQTTNESGTVAFQKSGRTFMVNPSGTDPAYNHAFVTATWSGAKVRYPSEYREFSVTRKDGVVEIPLQCRWIGGKELSPEKAAATASREENRPKSDTRDAAQQDNPLGIADTRPGS
jgi:hypothetical protein